MDYVYIDKSSIPDEPTRGIHRVEVAFRSLKNKQDGGKHPGTHYWMVNYYINKIIGPADQMNPQPNISSIWPGKEDEAARNSADATGNAPAPVATPRPTATVDTTTQAHRMTCSLTGVPMAPSKATVRTQSSP